MNIQSEKLRLIQLLINTENPSIINKVKEVFKSSNDQDIWLELSASEQAEISNAIEEAISDQTINYDVFMSQHRK